MKSKSKSRRKSKKPNPKTNPTKAHRRSLVAKLLRALLPREGDAATAQRLRRAVEHLIEPDTFNRLTLGGILATAAQKVAPPNCPPSPPHPSSPSLTPPLKVEANTDKLTGAMLSSIAPPAPEGSRLSPLPPLRGSAPLASTDGLKAGQGPGNGDYPVSYGHGCAVETTAHPQYEQFLRKHVRLECPVRYLLTPPEAPPRYHAASLSATVRMFGLIEEAYGRVGTPRRLVHSRASRSVHALSRRKVWAPIHRLSRALTYLGVSTDEQRRFYLRAVLEYHPRPPGQPLLPLASLTAAGALGYYLRWLVHRWRRRVAEKPSQEPELMSSYAASPSEVGARAAEGELLRLLEGGNGGRSLWQREVPEILNVHDMASGLVGLVSPLMLSLLEAGLLAAFPETERLVAELAVRASEDAELRAVVSDLQVAYRRAARGMPMVVEGDQASLGWLWEDLPPAQARRQQPKALRWFQEVLGAV